MGNLALKGCLCSRGPSQFSSDTSLSSRHIYFAPTPKEIRFEKKENMRKLKRLKRQNKRKEYEQMMKEVQLDLKELKELDQCEYIKPKEVPREVKMEVEKKSGRSASFEENPNQAQFDD